MAQGFDAGAIIAKLELQKQQWDASMRDIQKDLSEVGKETETTSKKMAVDWEAMAKKTALAITAVTGALFALVKKTADYGDELWKTSQKTGIAVETLSSMQLAADKSDLSLSALATGLARMSRTVNEAQLGMKEYQDILDRAGITATDSTGKMKPMDTLLGELADKFKSMPAGVEKTALAMDIFGRAGMDMIPLLNLGSEGLKKEREEAERLGIVMSGSAAQASEVFNDELTTLKKALLGVTLTIGKELMPTFQGIVEGVVKIVASFNKWLSQNPEIVQSIRNIIESIRWLITGIKDAIEWVGKMSDKLSGMAKFRAQVMAQMAAAESKFQKEQEEGHAKWLARHEQITAKRKASTELFYGWFTSFYKGQEQQQTSIITGEASKRESIVEKQFSKLEKEANDYFKKMMTYSGQEVKGEIIDWRKRTVNVQQMTQKMKNYFVEGMNNLNIKGKETTVKVKKSFSDMMQGIQGYIQVMQQGFSQFFQGLQQMSQNRYQTEMNLMDSEYARRKQAIEDSLLSETEKQEALSALDAEYAEKKKSLEIKQAAANKKSGIAQAIVNTALAITSALSTKPFFPMGLIAAAVAAAAGAIQIAVIKSTPLPAMAKGGFVDQPTPAIIGDAGPEVVTPLADFKEMMGIGKGDRRSTPNLNISITAFDGKDVERVTRKRIIPEIKRALGRESFRVPARAVG